MQLRGFLRFGWIGSLAVMGLMGAAYAQEGGETPAPVTDSSADMTRDVQLSPEEMVQESAKVLSGMETAAQSVRKMLAAAREQRDVVKALCLEDKLTQMDVTRRSAGERADSLRQAAARQDRELSTHEYTILVVLKERTAQLSAEANQCIGVEAGFVGDSTVTVDIDPNLPADDPSEFPDSPIITVPPGCVSCVQ